MSVGTDLRLARERAKLSVEQISERLKVSIQKIEALERDDLQQLPPGIYLDGIVRAYAREVAIDPESVVQHIHEAAGELGRWDVSSDLEAFPEEAVVRPEGAPVAPGTLEIHEPYLMVPPKDSTISPLRHAREHRARGFTAVGLGLMLLAAVVWSGYRYGREVTQRLEAHKTVAAANMPSARPEPAANRPPEPKSSTEVTVNSEGSSNPPRDRILLPAPTAPLRRPAATGQRTPKSPAPQRGVGDISGPWTFVTHVESSSVPRFADLHLGYRIQLEQSGGRIKGAGRKISEGGDAISARAQTPIEVDGTIEGDSLTLSFAERGTRRPTQGKFVLLLDDAGTLRGRFSSTAARSSGTVEAHRLVQ
jgi:cytoskeletal protein RodZ